MKFETGESRVAVGAVAISDSGTAEDCINFAVMLLARLLGRQIVPEEFGRLIGANDKAPVVETGDRQETRRDPRCLLRPLFVQPATGFPGSPNVHIAMRPIPGEQRHLRSDPGTA